MDHFSIPIDISSEEYAIKLKKLYIHWMSHAPQIIIARLLAIINFVWSLTIFLVRLTLKHEFSPLVFFACISSIIIALFAPQLRYFIFKKKKLRTALQNLTFYPEKFCLQFKNINEEFEYSYNDLHKVEILDYGFIFYLKIRYKFTRVFFMFPVDFFTEDQLNSLRSWLSKKQKNSQDKCE